MRKILVAPNAEITGDLSNIPIKQSCSPTQPAVKGIDALDNVKIKNKIANTGIYVVNPLIYGMILVWSLTYIIPPTQINRAGETNPWAKDSTRAPSIPITVLENKPNTINAQWLIEERATKALESWLLNADKDAYIKVIIHIPCTKGL